MVINRILQVGDRNRLTHTIHEEPHFRAGVIVSITEVKISPYTPPPGMQRVLTPATAMYEFEVQIAVPERVDVGDEIRSGRVPHALLSTTQGGQPATQIYGPTSQLFLLGDFHYKYRSGQKVIPAGSMVKTVDRAMSMSERSIARHPSTATYRVIVQRPSTREITVKTMQPYQKIYFE